MTSVTLRRHCEDLPLALEAAMPATLTDTTTATVIATTIIGTAHTTVTAWEPYAGHTSSRSDELGGRLGQITARPLPAAIEAMAPGSPERIEACVDFAAANVRDAYAAINEVYPHLLDRDDARLDRGSVSIWHSTPTAVPCHGGCGSLEEPNFIGIAWCGESGR